MIWPFELPFMQLALAAGAIVGLTTPLIGAFVVQKRLSLMGDGIGHVAFAGVGIGLLAGVFPVWTALALAVSAAVGLELLRRSGVAGDLALALLFYAGLALGVVIAGKAGALNASILPYLFGSILTVRASEVWVIAALGAAIVVAVALAGRALFAVVVDEESARVAGLPVDALSVGLSALVAVTIVAAMRAVGLLLVAALMVLPVGASQAIARSFRATLLGSAAIGVGSVVAGLTAARAWGLAPGGAIVLAAALAFALASAVGARRPSRRIPGITVGPDEHAPHAHGH